MKRNDLIFLIVLILTSISVSSQTTINGSFMSDGILRNYRLYIPEMINPLNPAPLILNLHGYGSNNIEQEAYADFRPIADTAGFILVHPNGTPDGSNNLHWNTFGSSNVDDVGFISALIDTISNSYNIDFNRVYSTGMSNGGFMSYSLACVLSHRIAAIASVTGTMITTTFNACDPQRPVPLMHIHGTADGTVPYNGNVFFVSVQSLLDYWVEHNNCSTTPVITEVPDIDPDDGCTAEHYLYTGGDLGSTVEHYKIIGGGHSWPGAPININITNMDFSASQEIWRFFRQYNLDGLITRLTENNEPDFYVSASPNPSNGLVNLSYADNGPKKIHVYNQLGQLIHHINTYDKNTTIYLPAKGLYFISSSINNSRITTNIVNQ
jgi:polyhydroxybutyrate depolymerase